MGRIEKRIEELGFSLPECPVPVAAYAPAVRINGFVYVSGQTPIAEGELYCKGRVGAEVSVEKAKKGAEICALRLLAQLKSVVENLDDVERIVYVQGFVNSGADFGEQPAVVNGASELLEAVFGDRGKHARAAVGVSALPDEAAVEVMMIAAVKGSGANLRRRAGQKRTGGPPPENRDKGEIRDAEQMV